MHVVYVCMCVLHWGDSGHVPNTMTRKAGREQGGCENACMCVRRNVACVCILGTHAAGFSTVESIPAEARRGLGGNER